MTLRIETNKTLSILNHGHFVSSLQRIPTTKHCCYVIRSHKLQSFYAFFQILGGTHQFEEIDNHHSI